MRVDCFLQKLCLRNNSSLYERLALSRDKDEVMRLVNEGQVVEKPRDILKNPLVLEFLGMDGKTVSFRKYNYKNP